MTTPDLKPCPFCGGKAKFDTVTWVRWEEPCIVCTKCEALFTTGWVDPSQSDLIEAWNRRANDGKGSDEG